MGVAFSCPLAAYFDLEDELESAIVKSIGFGNDQPKRKIRTQNRETEAVNLGPSTGNESKEMTLVKQPQVTILDSNHPKHEAAIKLQKVYKSFRTRRKLADCAVLIEQSWWKLLDFAELKHSSISFFDLDKHETATSRWSRARTRAAKVGKGLSKNGKAQKLALQHWLEAIDPRHRYGHNLHFYYVKWLHSQSKEPFFYWLDIGEGKEVNLVEKCPRSKLQQQCIKYLGPMERMAFEVVVEDGKFLYKQTGELLDTSVEPKAKWIFVLSTTRTLYVSKKKKGSFQHSSFLAGGATLAAGRIIVDKGVLKAVWPHSGHYRPTPENFQDFILFLKENNVDLTDVKLDSVDEEESLKRANIGYLRRSSSEQLLGKKDGSHAEYNEVRATAADLPKSSPLHQFVSKLTNLQIPSKADLLETLQTENQADKVENGISPPESPRDGYDTTEDLFTSEEVTDNLSCDLSGEELDDTKDETAPKEPTVERISSHERRKSYHLGKPLSSKWSTGAGPRIGCLRVYPSELQSHALEQANLSPRSNCSLRFNFPSCVSTPTGLSREVRSSPFRSSPEKGKLTLSDAVL